MAFFPAGKAVREMEKLKNQIVIYRPRGLFKRYANWVLWGGTHRHDKLNLRQLSAFPPPHEHEQVFNSKVDLVQKDPSINLFITAKLCRIYMHPADRRVTTPGKSPHNKNNNKRTSRPSLRGVAFCSGIKFEFHMLPALIEAG